MNKVFISLLAALVLLAGAASAEPIKPQDTILVQQLPGASKNTAKTYLVRDSLTGGCGAGGGNTYVMCESDGSAWIARQVLGTGGGGGGGGAGNSVFVNDPPNFVGVVECATELPDPLTGTIPNCEARVTVLNGTTLADGWLRLSGNYIVATPHDTLTGFKPIEGTFISTGCNNGALECGDNFTTFAAAYQTLAAQYDAFSTQAPSKKIKFQSHGYQVDTRAPFLLEGTNWALDFCGGPSHIDIVGNQSASVRTFGGATASLTVATNARRLTCASCSFCGGDADCANDTDQTVRPGDPILFAGSGNWHQTGRTNIVSSIIDDDTIDLLVPETSDYSGTIEVAYGKAMVFDATRFSLGTGGTVELLCGHNLTIGCAGTCRSVDTWSTPQLTAPTNRTVPIQGVVSYYNEVDLSMNVIGLYNRNDACMTVALTNAGTSSGVHGEITGGCLPGNNPYQNKMARTNYDDTTTADDGWGGAFRVLAPNIYINPRAMGAGNRYLVTGENCGNMYVDARLAENWGQVAYFPLGCSNVRMQDFSRELGQFCGDVGQPTCETLAGRKPVIEINEWLWPSGPNGQPAVYDLAWGKAFHYLYAQIFLKATISETTRITMNGMVHRTADLLDITGGPVEITGHVQCYPDPGTPNACDWDADAKSSDFIVTDWDGDLLYDRRAVSGLQGVSAFAPSLLDDADAATARATLGAAASGGYTANRCVQTSGAGVLEVAAGACGSASGYATVDDENTPLTQRTTLNFAGAGVSCVDDTTQTTCTIPGGGAAALDDLSDVIITTPATGATIVYNGTAFVDGPIDLADTDAVTGQLADANVSNTLQASILVGSGSTTNAVDLATAEVAGTLPVGNGGTGVASLTDGGILLGSGTGAITPLGVALNGQVPIGDGTTDPILGTISGTTNEVEITNGPGTITVGIPTNPTLTGNTTITGTLGSGAITSTGSITAGDPGDGSRGVTFTQNTSAIGAPAASQCKIGFVGTTLNKHCNGGSLTSIEGGATIENEAVGSAWNGDTTNGAAKDNLHDWLVIFDPDYDGGVDQLETSAGAGPTANGRVAYDSTANALEYGDNGTNRTVVNTDESQTLTNKTLAAASNVIDADTAVALAANGSNCVTSTHFAVGVDASGVAECEAIADADVPDTITVNLAAEATTLAAGHELLLLSANCVLENDATPIPDSCVGDGSDAGGAGSLPAVDTTSLVEGSVDPTKEVRIEADGITTGTVRVWTAPDEDITVVGTAATQVLTNKTLSAANNIIDADTATVATALANNPTDCGAGTAATAIAANGDLTCSITPATDSSTTTFTNKTYDTAATGNSFKMPEVYPFEVVSCVGTTGTLQWDTDATGAPTATCTEGATETDLVYGQANFADAALARFQRRIKLPGDWSDDDITVNLKWKSNTTTTTLTAVWQIEVACVATAVPGGAAFDTDIASVADDGLGTANQLNDATITLTNATTLSGCAAGNMMWIQLFRDPAHASDDLAATASLVDVELILNRTM